MARPVGRAISDGLVRTHDEKCQPSRGDEKRPYGSFQPDCRPPRNGCFRIQRAWYNPPRFHLMETRGRRLWEGYSFVILRQLLLCLRVFYLLQTRRLSTSPESLAGCPSRTWTRLELAFRVLVEDAHPDVADALTAQGVPPESNLSRKKSITLDGMCHQFKGGLYSDATARPSLTTG